MGAEAGVDPGPELYIFDSGTARTGWTTSKTTFVFNNKASISNSRRWTYKDTCLALHPREELEVPLPLTSLAQQMFRARFAKESDRNVYALISMYYTDVTDPGRAHEK